MLVDVAHESSVLFLRHTRRNSFDLNLLGIIDEDDDAMLEAQRRDDMTTNDTFDSELVQAGGVQTNLCLDNLLIQSVYYKDIVSFWESALCSGNQWNAEPVQSIAADNLDDEQSVVGEIFSPQQYKAPTTPHLQRNSMNSRRQESKMTAAEQQDQTTTTSEDSAVEYPFDASYGPEVEVVFGGQEGQDKQEEQEEGPERDGDENVPRGCWQDSEQISSTNQPQHQRGQSLHQGLGGPSSLPSFPRSRSSSFGNVSDDPSPGAGGTSPNGGPDSGTAVDRIAVPATCVGQTFSALFHHLFESTRQIPFAVYRQSTQPIGEYDQYAVPQLPYSIVCPNPDMKLRVTDLVFIFTCNSEELQFESYMGYGEEPPSPAAA